MDAFLERLSLLLKEETLEHLKNKHVLIAGCGGVGSFVAEALSRSGIGHLTLVDFDIVDASNLNRQLMTTRENIGLSKVMVLKRRIEEISNANVDVIECFIDEHFEIKEHYDYVVDCIDTLTSKFLLVKQCHQKGIPVLSSMGTARRLEVKNITLTTLDKTRNDPLAKTFRNLVKKENYRHKIEVVYVDTPALETREKVERTKGKAPLGSSIFVVGSAGLYIASIVFQRLMKEDV